MKETEGKQDLPEEERPKPGMDPASMVNMAMAAIVFWGLIALAVWIVLKVT